MLFVCLSVCVCVLHRKTCTQIEYIYYFYLFVCLSVCTSSIEDLHTDRTYICILLFVHTVNLGGDRHIRVDKIQVPEP